MNESLELPAGPAPPLHILEPSVPWLWILVMLVALYYLLRWLFRVPPAPEVSPTPRPSTPPVPAPGLVEQIDTLRSRFQGATADYRQGCHELAELLRHSFRSSAGSLRTLTAGEILKALGDTSFAQVFGLLAEMQFRRRTPDSDDFESICDLARNSVRSHQTGKAST